jgi:hypothetical protein
MAPAFKLQVLLLAKLQWDVRHGPARPAQPRDRSGWSAQPLARALRHMVSPCVAGDLLQQRAPGLGPHICKAHTPMVNRQRRVVGKQEVEQPFDVIPANRFGTYLTEVGRPLRAFLMDGVPFNHVGENSVTSCWCVCVCVHLQQALLALCHCVCIPCCAQVPSVP